MNLSLLLDMAASGFGERVVLGGRDDGITAAALRSRAEAGAALIADSGAGSVLRRSKTPDTVVFVESLPYSDLGKLSRRAVAQLVEDAG